MPVIAVSNDLTRRFAGTVAPTDLVLQLKTADRAQLFVPDKYAAAAVGCSSGDREFQRFNEEYGSVWFRGEAAAAPRIIPVGGDNFAGIVSFEGAVYRCQKGQLLAASGVKVELPLEQVDPGGVPVRPLLAW